MSDLTGVVVGDKLIMTHAYTRRDPLEVVVTKVGREYLHTSAGRFRRTTGTAAGDRDHRRVSTPAQCAESLAVSDLIAELRCAGVEFSAGKARSLGPDALRAILTIVREAP